MNNDLLDHKAFSACRNVYLAQAPAAEYESCRVSAAPELHGPCAVSPAAAALREMFQCAGLDPARFGQAEWNPLAAVIRPGDRVLIKPNWVLHESRSGHGLDSLVTHPSLIETVLQYAMKTSPASVVIGDAPLQACDFSALMRTCGIEERVERSGAGGAVSVRDFRLVTRDGHDRWAQTGLTSRSLDEYVLFDLGRDSSLEPITRDDSEFRVTMYDPQGLRSTHGVGRHQYLIARELIEADVVLNLPKLKTHKKAGMTGALKNMVGANGHKQYLPHHRKGGAAGGGDCYPGSSGWKSLAEDMLDQGNRRSGVLARGLCSLGASAALRAGSLFGGDNNVEGAWHGNDTLWRMTLDLQTILHYGRSDGRLDSAPQRRVLSITDAIIAGEGEGPLAPIPAPIGVLTMSANTAAADWVGAALLGYDPSAICLTREAFRTGNFPLTEFAPDDIVVRAPGGEMSVADMTRRFRRKVIAPQGWKDLETPPAGKEQAA
ncbi:MAG TPA: DUF362 domain-containing protein [Bryobacteraceae bacterium]|nr:DUF362 domain-containing protein [Bryobacteraceae bacterium]